MNDPILFWNDVTNEMNRVDHSPPGSGTQGGPTRSSRATAIAHLAMHDAFSALPADSHSIWVHWRR